jgi:hypothetical protein
MSVVTLELHASLFAALLSGAKRSTIRRGVRQVNVGDDIRFTASKSSGTQRVALAHVVGVRQKRVEDLTVADGLTDGFSTLDELLTALRTFYPDLRPQETLTIIEVQCLGAEGPEGEPRSRFGGR